jgi:hypothetical protein
LNFTSNFIKIYFFLKKPSTNVNNFVFPQTSLRKIFPLVFLSLAKRAKKKILIESSAKNVFFFCTLAQKKEELSKKQFSLPFIEIQKKKNKFIPK